MNPREIELLDPIAPIVQEHTVGRFTHDFKGSRGGIFVAQAPWRAWNVFMKRFKQVAIQKYELASLSFIGDPAAEGGAGGMHAVATELSEGVVFDELARKLDWALVGAAL